MKEHLLVALQKAFDIVEHDILLTKLKHYEVRGLAKDWFTSYLSDREQFVSINGHKSSLASILYGVPQISVFAPLLFLMYINDLNQARKFHHFADETNLLHFSKSVTKLNKYVNLDIKNLTDCLNVNKISLNMQKTELAIFKHQRKKIRLNLVESDSITQTLLKILALELIKI